MTSKREAKLTLFALINILDRTSSFDGPDSETIPLWVAAYGSGLPFQGGHRVFENLLRVVQVNDADLSLSTPHNQQLL